ncbi:MAG: Holliday junction branch migration protein RuvA [Deltaproteobacteria bacterium]|nr:Holliday junction branch migration protein RuvA [Deltaproteobacteria bacterium]
MIAHLKGILFKKTPGSMIIDNGGIGYEVFVPLSTFYALPDEAEKVSLHIYTHVREDALVLFGFQTTLEKKIFTLLIAVSGIGPRLAINILSGIGPSELLEAIAGGDAVRLQAIPGVGKKTAERIVLELKDKAQKIKGGVELTQTLITSDPDKRILDDAASALMNLGYPAKSARSAVDKTVSQMKEPKLEEVIKEALKFLAS